MNEEPSLPKPQEPASGRPANEPPAEEARRTGASSRRTMRLVMVGVVALGVGYLFAWLPAWRAQKQHAARVEQFERRLAFGGLQNMLASAAIDARRGEYEAARQSASRFFTELRAEIDLGPASILAGIPRENIEPLFSQRDQVITLLARSDPASADRLSDLHVSFRKVIDSAGLTN